MPFSKKNLFSEANIQCGHKTVPELTVQQIGNFPRITRLSCLTLFLVGATISNCVLTLQVGRLAFSCVDLYSSLIARLVFSLIDLTALRAWHYLTASEIHVAKSEVW